MNFCGEEVGACLFAKSDVLGLEAKMMMMILQSAPSATEAWCDPALQSCLLKMYNHLDLLQSGWGIRCQQLALSQRIYADSGNDRCGLIILGKLAWDALR